MELTLQDLLDAVTGLPDDADDAARRTAVAELLAERDADAEAFANQALEEFTRLREGGDSPTAETLAALEALTVVVEGSRDRQTSLDDAARARAESLAALEARVTPAAGGGEGDGEDGDGTGGAGGGDGEGTGGSEGSEGEATAGGEGGEGAGGEGGGGAGEGEGAAAAAGANAAVNASGQRRRNVRVDLAHVRRVHPPVRTDEPARTVITAAADVPGYSAGQRLNMDDLTTATVARMSAFPKHRIENLSLRSGIASIRIPFTDSRLVAKAGGDDQAVLDYAGNPARLEGGSVLASGGWCSPSETLYDLCPGIESASAGMIDVPDISIPRGGIRTTEGPDIGSVYSSIGFKQTEAQAIAGTTKPSYRVPCPDFVDTRAGVSGVNIISGILNNDAYPEMTKRTLELAVAVHAHQYNADTIAQMASQCTAVTGNQRLGPSATLSLMNVLEMQIADYKYRYRADENLVVDVVLPHFMLNVIRADLSMRSYDSYTDNVPTDQQIIGMFNARKANPQFVYDWQDAFTTTPATPPLFGGTDAITAWPASVKVMIFAAGAFVRGRGELISLEGVYDSTNLEVNDFTALFMEEKLLVKRRCYQARLVTVPLDVNGTASAPQILDGTGNIVPAA